jgi:hypothetical protein
VALSAFRPGYEWDRYILFTNRVADVFVGEAFHSKNVTRTAPWTGRGLFLHRQLLPLLASAKYGVSLRRRCDGSTVPSRRLFLNDIREYIG